MSGETESDEIHRIVAKEMMNTLVIGYGSIGSRHARILKELGCHTAVLSKRSVDFAPHYQDLSEALKEESPGYVVVANTTAEHHETLVRLKQSGYKALVMVEKPLFSHAEEMDISDFSRVAVAYNLRFHPVIRRLKDLVSEETVVSVQCYVGQYLPQWRPSVDYRQASSAMKAKGGGVLRDLSHELDYLAYLFGPWKRLSAIGGHLSHLEIDVDDVFSILMATQKCPAVTLQLNYLDRSIHREMIINTERHTIKADLIRGSICLDKETPEVFQAERDLTYRLEHQAILEGRSEGLCTFHEGMEIMKMIMAIEEAAYQQKWVMNPGSRQ